MDAVAGVCMGTGRVNGLLQPEEDQMQTMRNVLERWGGPQQILLERMKGQRKWSRGDSLALQTGCTVVRSPQNLLTHHLLTWPLFSDIPDYFPLLSGSYITSQSLLCFNIKQPFLLKVQL